MSPTTRKNIPWAWPGATAFSLVPNSKWCCCFHLFQAFEDFLHIGDFSSLPAYTLWPSSLRLPLSSQKSLRAQRMKNEQPSHLIQSQSSLIKESEKMHLYNLSNCLLNVSGHVLKAYSWLFLLSAGLFLTWRISFLLCNLCLKHCVLLCSSYLCSFKRGSPSHDWAAICFCLLGQLRSS